MTWVPALESLTILAMVVDAHSLPQVHSGILFNFLDGPGLLLPVLGPHLLHPQRAGLHFLTFPLVVVAQELCVVHEADEDEGRLSQTRLGHDSGKKLQGMKSWRRKAVRS